MKPEEAVRLRNAVNTAVEEADKQGHPDFKTSPRVMETLNIWEKSEAAKSYILSERWAAMAAQLLGVPSVRLYQDAALFKVPGATGTGWHQDNRYMVFGKTVTLWIALNDIPGPYGSLSFVSGSHRAGDLQTEEMKLLTRADRKGYSSIVNYGWMKAGDATFHDGWTIHSAPANTRHSVREALVVIYYPDNAPMLDVSEYPSRSANYRRWFPGGEADARGPLHPLLVEL